VIGFALLIAGCQNESKPAGAKPASGAACTQFGQSCEYSPGKLGTCVTKPECEDTKGSCFVCQSQH
jgi:hypothetical protein